MTQQDGRGRKTARRGFAAMDKDRQREIARKGGASVPDEKRSFSQDRDLAAAAGRKGGAGVPDKKRSFPQDRDLAAAPGRRGGKASHGGGRRRASDARANVQA